MVTHDPELARRAHRNVQVVDGQISDFKPYEPHAAATTPTHGGIAAIAATGA
jgi:putative ABC transport system ATP-binding protein